MGYTKQHLIRRLRAAHGYSINEATRTVRDVLSALRDLLDDLDTDESLMLEHVGRLQCQVRILADGSNGHAIRFQPCETLAAQLHRRSLPQNDPRVILARGARRRRP
jgi:hypothetical protein